MTHRIAPTSLISSNSAADTKGEKENESSTFTPARKNQKIEASTIQRAEKKESAPLSPRASNSTAETIGEKENESSTFTPAHKKQKIEASSIQTAEKKENDPLSPRASNSSSSQSQASVIGEKKPETNSTPTLCDVLHKLFLLKHEYFTSNPSARRKNTIRQTAAREVDALNLPEIFKSFILATHFESQEKIQAILNDRAFDPSLGGNYTIKWASMMGQAELVGNLLRKPRVTQAENAEKDLKIAQDLARNNGHETIVTMLSYVISPDR